MIDKRVFYSNSDQKQAKIVGILFACISLLCAIEYVGINLPGNTFLVWGVNFSIIGYCIYRGIKENLLFDTTHFLCFVFLVWAFVGAIRGVPDLKNYWYVKQFLYGVMCVSLPCIVYLFNKPIKTIRILQYWSLIIAPLFVFIFSWSAKPGAHHFYLGQFYFLYGLFLFWLSRKWKAFLIFVIVIMLFMDTEARAQVLKAALCVVFAIALKYHSYIPLFFVRLSCWIFYIGAVTLLVLGISGTYNIFDHTDPLAQQQPVVYSNGEYSYYTEADGGALLDTRTFIYIEVIESALNNDYVLSGRTLARGNDSASFGKDSMVDEEERYDNELCHLNIFTWLGLIGVIIYSLIYIQASWLACYRSNNVFIKYFGVMIAFHWFFGWIEDQNIFNSVNISLWMIIGICLSPNFRNLSNQEFLLWIKAITRTNGLIEYTLYPLIKKRLLLVFLKSKQK